MYIILEKSECRRPNLVVYADWVFEDLDDVEEYLLDNGVEKAIVASITPMYKMSTETRMVIKKERCNERV